MQRLNITLVAIFAIFAFTGCASMQTVDLSKGHNIELKKDDTPQGKIRNIKVIKTKEQIMVTGLVVRERRNRLLNGHVHVDIYDKYNVIQQSIDSDYKFRRHGLRRAKAAKFRAALAAIPQDDSRIVVTHHSAKTAAEPARALPDTPPVAGGGFLLIE